MATAIYSPLPSYFETNEEVLIAYYTGKIYRNPLLYPALAWSLEEISGTTWRNIHSGASVFIGGLSQSDEGPVPIPVYAYPLFEEQFGFWQGGRYIVEDWVRVDHLAPQIELSWFGVELKYLQALIDVAEFEQELADDEVEFKIQGDIINAANEAINTVMARLYDFLDAHNLTAADEASSSLRRHIYQPETPYFGFVPGEQVIWQN
jgi:hypothetical protein